MRTLDRPIAPASSRNRLASAPTRSVTTNRWRSYRPRPGTRTDTAVFPRLPVQRILVIQRALEAGFSLADLRRVLRIRDAGGIPCRQVYAIAEQRLGELERRIADLETLRPSLLMPWASGRSRWSPQPATDAPACSTRGLLGCGSAGIDAECFPASMSVELRHRVSFDNVTGCFKRRRPSHTFRGPYRDYPDPAGASILQILQSRVEIEPFNAIATGIFYWRSFTRLRPRASLGSRIGFNTTMTLARGRAARRRGRACSRGSCTSSAKSRWCSVSGLSCWPWRSPRTKAGRLPNTI